MAGVFFAGGLLFGAYYLALISFSGIRATFSLFWLALSVLCWIGYAYIKIGKIFPGRFRLPLAARVFLVTSIILFFVLFLAVESFIIGGMLMKEPAEEPACVIVLGAQVRGTQPSKTLRQRLDAAVDYWEEHPDVMFIVSGGQGVGEEISEAQAMYEYLMAAGVPRGRVIREDESTNTVENIQNSMKILRYLDGPVAVVSSDFHLFRATQIAEKLMGQEVSGLPAKTDWILLPNYMVREFFAVLKDWYFGRI